MCVVQHASDPLAPPFPPGPRLLKPGPTRRKSCLYVKPRGCEKLSDKRSEMVMNIAGQKDGRLRRPCFSHDAHASFHPEIHASFHGPGSLKFMQNSICGGPCLRSGVGEGPGGKGGAKGADACCTTHIYLTPPPLQ
jgi:hypothetical protein